MFLFRVNDQIRPWIFTRRSISFLNYTKYQLSLWICQTSIKKVPPSKCSVSHADLSPCMLCCLVRVARRKPGTDLIELEKVEFSLFSFFFCFSHFAPALPYLLLHISETSKTSLTLLLSAKTFSILTPPKSSSSPTILTFLKFLCSVVIKCNAFPVVYQDSEDVGHENAPNEVPENVMLGNAPNFVPDNVVSENAKTAGNVVANAGQVWLLIFKDRFGN